MRASPTLAVDNNEGTQAPSDFAARLMGLADDAARLRAHARTTGNSSLLVRAMSAEQSAITTLMTRLGVDHVETVTALTTLDRIYAALVRLILDDPAFGERLADELDAVGATDVAGEIRAFEHHKPIRAVPNPGGQQ